MKNPRLVYRVILKTMLFLGLLILLYVLFSSLFSGNTSKELNNQQISDAKIQIVTLDLSEMMRGHTLKTRWNGKTIIVLKRPYDSQYSVYFNTGDSGNCPLYYSSNIFKDTCTSTIYDEFGQEVEKKSPKHLSSPPYFIKDSVLYIGKTDKE